MDKERIKEILKTTQVLCYSEEQGCPHLENLEQHISSNYYHPNNSYFIVKFIDGIPKELVNDKVFDELSKYIRFKSINYVDFSRLQVDIPEINKYKKREVEELED